MAPLAYHFGACLSFPSIRTWVTGSHLLWRWPLPAGLLREGVGPGDCCVVRLVTARQWANPPGRLRPTELPPGKREVLGCFFSQLSSYCLDFLQYKTVSRKSIPGSPIVGPILFYLLLYQKLLSKRQWKYLLLDFYLLGTTGVSFSAEVFPVFIW